MEKIHRIKEQVIRLINWEYAPLCSLILIMLVLHFNIILQQSDMAFDEHYYITAARSIIQGAGTDRVEHPPLGQILIASGILLFGDNLLGWRFFSVIFGIALIILFYLICRQVKMSKDTAFLATFLLSIENLSFVLASVAMLDVYSLTFVLASFLLYLKGKPAYAGLSVGLATLAKMTGVFALPVLFLFWIFTDRKNMRPFLMATLAGLATFFVLMPIFNFIIWHKYIDPLNQTLNMLEYSKSFTFAEADPEGFHLSSRPWDWIFHMGILPGPIVWDMWARSRQWVLFYSLMISPFVWALIIPSMILLIIKTIKRDIAATLALSWFAGTYLLWIPISLATDRVSYLYYFYPSVGAICISISSGITQLSEVGIKIHNSSKVSRLFVPLYLLISLIFFIASYPASLWLTVPASIFLYAVARFYLERGQVEKGIVPAEAVIVRNQDI